MKPMNLTLRTLTPLWSGGIDQTSDRLHETGLIGSLRWWYEALVRGLGGYACDPTSDDPNARCEFDTKAYEQTKKNGKGENEAIQAGLHTVCPVCYLFGAAGWARLFQLRAIEVPMTPLHFRTTLKMNQGWLNRVFGGDNQNIDSLQVPYGTLTFQLIPRRCDAEYARSQIALILRVAAEYGGIGARLQHGFGQFVFPPELGDISLESGLEQLKTKIRGRFLRSSGPTVDTPYNMSNFVSMTFEIQKNALRNFMQEKNHEESYIPCAFDLRYKGSGNFGMRKWLKGKGWKETKNPNALEELDWLLGPRSQWGSGRNRSSIDDELRTASRVFFGMPYQKPTAQGIYILRIWAFLPDEIRHKLPDVQALKNLIEEYMGLAFGNQAKLVSSTFGKDILAGGAK
ncbi:MAG: type III-B CRISPR module RAMP protein Cmr1 [Anaerolineae bacterium]|jgi:CRISPR-associated protein Cmr1|nr:MAG: type III-B CRISPR module RAMP protein Cmr1 [Anaerolineae bacterium]